MGAQRIRLAELSAQKYPASGKLHAKERQEVGTYDTELTFCSLERQVIVPEIEIANLKTWKGKGRVSDRSVRGRERACRQRTPCCAIIQKELARNAIGAESNIGRRAIWDGAHLVSAPVAESLPAMVSGFHDDSNRKNCDC